MPVYNPSSAGGTDNKGIIRGIQTSITNGNLGGGTGWYLVDQWQVQLSGSSASYLGVFEFDQAGFESKNLALTVTLRRNNYTTGYPNLPVRFAPVTLGSASGGFPSTIGTAVAELTMAIPAQNGATTQTSNPFAAPASGAYAFAFNHAVGIGNGDVSYLLGITLHTV